MSEYDTDILFWSTHQAELLRRLAAGERVNDRVDWDNLIDEVESVGRNELPAVQSHLVQALLHDLKAKEWPSAREVDHWQAEARSQRRQVLRAYSPSMGQRLSLDELYADALYSLPETIDGVAPLPVPETCPYTLDDLLSNQ